MVLGFLGTLIALERAHDRNLAPWPGALRCGTYELGAYDAELHAIFLGFVMSMIFAHASVIVPSVLGRPLPFRNYLYLPLVLLHVSLIVRLAGGDWAGNTIAWQWGGSLNEVAVLLFLTMAAVLVIRSRRPARRTVAAQEAVLRH